MIMFTERAKKLFLFIAVLISCSFLFMPGPWSVATTFASSGTEHSASTTESSGQAGHGTEAKDRTADLIDLLYRFISFALMVVILYVVIKKTRITDNLSVRSEEIRKKLDTLKQKKEEAEIRYQELEKQINDFETRRKDIIEEYRAEGLQEKEKIIAEAKERVDQIIRQSEMTIEQEIITARERLKQEIIEHAARKAQEIITQNISDNDQSQLIDDFIERVGKLH